MLTDLTLPGIDGEEMIGRMRVCMPKLRVIVTCGKPYEPTNEPFLPKMLAEQIENRGSTRFLFFAPTAVGVCVRSRSRWHLAHSDSKFISALELRDQLTGECDLTLPSGSVLVRSLNGADQFGHRGSIRR